jgi:hypothetical protein
MDNRRADDGRREEDRRWLKVQKDVMDLITTQRTNQQVLATMEIELGKIQEHVEEVDDHLRGVAGRDSLDTRVTLTEKDLVQHGVMLHRISDQFTHLQSMIHQQLGDIKTELGKLQFQKAMQDEAEKSKSDRFKEWMRLWGSTIAAILAFVTAATTVTVENWDKIVSSFHSPHSMGSNVDQWMTELEKRKHDPKVKKMLSDRYGQDVD